MKLLIVLLTILLIACYQEESYDYQHTQIWYVHSYLGTSTSRCFDSDDNNEYPNAVMPLFLGLEDDRVYLTAIHLKNNGEFFITKDGVSRMDGVWKKQEQTLTFDYENIPWNTEVVLHNKDSLVLKADGYSYLSNLTIVLKSAL